MWVKQDFVSVWNRVGYRMKRRRWLGSGGRMGEVGTQMLKQTGWGIYL